MIINKVIFQRQLFPVIKKGQVMSNYYRLMNRQGGQRYCCYQLDLDQSEHYLDYDDQVVTLGCRSARL